VQYPGQEHKQNSPVFFTFMEHSTVTFSAFQNSCYPIKILVSFTLGGVSFLTSFTMRLASSI
jgi:hypothetical protein